MLTYLRKHLAAAVTMLALAAFGLSAAGALPTIFANQSGIVAASLLDGDFNAVAQMGVVSCTATGANSLALAPNANQPTVTAYSPNQLYGFIAAGTSTGPVTININSVGALVLFTPSGVAVTSGGLVAGTYYIIVYNPALASNTGGFQLLTSQTTLNLPDGTTATTQAPNDTSTNVATDAFANPGATLSANGFDQLPSAAILEWGTSGTILSGGSISITFPKTYPGAPFSITITALTQCNVGQSHDFIDTITTAGFTLHNAAGCSSNFYWMSIGN